MVYTPATWSDGVTSGNATRFNNMETGIRNGYSSVLDVDGKFGANWAGVQAAITEAQNSGGPSAKVVLGKGDYEANSTITITEPISIQGAGRHQTRIKHAAGFSGFVFQAFTGRRNGNWEGSTGTAGVDLRPTPLYSRTGDNAGMELRDFAIIDDDRNTNDRGGIWLCWIDDLLMSNVTFGYLTGTALKLGMYPGDTGPSAGVNIPAGSGRVRESNFEDINIYRCGRDLTHNGADVPAFIIQTSDGNGDGMNQNIFHRTRFVFNEGRWLMRGREATGGKMRRTTFRDTQIHALYDGDWVPPYRNTGDIVTLEGLVGSTIFDGVVANANQAGTALFAMVANSFGEVPNRLSIRNVNTVNVGGDFLRVDAGTNVMLDGDFQDIGQMLLRNNNPSIGTYHVNAYGASSPAGKVTRTHGTGTVLFNGATLGPTA